MFFVPLILGIGAILVLVLGTPASAAYAKSMQPNMEPRRPDLHKESSKAHKPTVPKHATPTEPPSAEEPVPAQPNLSLVVQRTGQVTSMALRDEEDRKKDAKKELKQKLGYEALKGIHYSLPELVIPNDRVTDRVTAA